MSIEFNAINSGYFKVFVDGSEVSKHIAEREACEACSKHLEYSDDVYYTHSDYKVVAKYTPHEWWPEEFTIFGDPAYKNQPPDAFGSKSPTNATRWVYDQTTDEPTPELIKAKMAEIVDPHLDMVWFDIEHWPVNGDTPEDLDNLRKLSFVISTARTERPDLKFGYYGELPPRDYWAPVGQDPAALALWEEKIAAIETLFDLVDIYFPSIYAFYDIPGNTQGDIDAWEVYARANIAKCTGRGKPVYPFIWPSLHPSGSPTGSPYVGDEYFRRMLDVCYDTAEGVFIWGAGYHGDWPNRDEYEPNPSWFQVLNQFKSDNGIE